MLRRLNVDEDYDCIKIFNGTWDRIYFYEDANEPYRKLEEMKTDDQYINFIPFTRNGKEATQHYDCDFLGIVPINKRNLDIEVMYNMLVQASANTDIFVCRLKNTTNGIRIRYQNFKGGTKYTNIGTMLRALDNNYPDGTSKKDNSYQKLDAAQTTKVSKELVKEKKEEKKMNDFSLTNIKDAIVRKVTTLDKKTITILGIIILLLLIATRYQDIKDILLGIKDKVKRSKNFKAMVTDGTNAVNGLKKIIGIKEDEQ